MTTLSGVCLGGGSGDFASAGGSGFHDAQPRTPTKAPTVIITDHRAMQ
ncbi:MAG: hypothetical protein U0892_20645 [Pirellulales bacterium]